MKSLDSKILNILYFIFAFINVRKICKKYKNITICFTCVNIIQLIIQHTMNIKKLSI